MDVARGPSIYRIAGLEGALGAGLDSAEVVFKFPRGVFVLSLFAMVVSASDADLAGLELAIMDHTEKALVSDGTTRNFAPLRALVGGKNRWFPLGIRVHARDRWAFQLRNTNAGAVTPRVFLRVRDVVAGDPASANAR